MSAQRAAQAFTAAFGAAPTHVWSAPGRVNLIGEHTDYNAGLCLPFALAERTYVAARTRSHDQVRLLSTHGDQRWEGTLDEVGPGAPTGWAAYPAGVLWALRRRGMDVPGLDLAITSDVPVGAGLSSSAALECAVAMAAAELTVGADAIDRDLLRQACIEAENVVAGAATGGLDQTVSLGAQPGHLMLLDFADGSREQVPWSLPERWRVLVVDTRAAHSLADGQYAARRDACIAAAEHAGVATLRDLEGLDDPWPVVATLPGDQARRVRHVLTENDRVRAAVAALRAGDADTVGSVMTASHLSLRDDYEVSCAELDLVVDTALAHGALGARMTGGGFGGSAIALVPGDTVEQTTAAIADAFDDAGFDDPAFLLATPSGPAGRET